jgi:SAM-dependent methyltransferase
MSPLFCRSCDAPLESVVVDLGLSPLSNSYVTPELAKEGEMFLPLRVYVCDVCLLVQLQAFETREHIFSNYAYLSSFSEGWLAHAATYVEAATQRLGLGATSLVVEVASNDGYLLQYFVARGVPVVGVEPAANVARIAVERGVRSEILFFGKQTARELRARFGAADLIVANNVLAHVPDLHDFVAGFAGLLADDGWVSVEFPHVLHLIEETQFDTIYHEHFCYYSLHAIEPVFARHGLAVVDVERLSTHGGSLRLWLRRTGRDSSSAAVDDLRADERRAGLLERKTYLAYAPKVHAVKRDLLEFLIQAAREGKRVAAYGAPAKGNTLLNYCGIRTDMLAFTVDRNPLKQGSLLPGTRIPVFAPERLLAERPDYVLILPWNIKDEIVAQMSNVRTWGGQFVIAIPQLSVE